MSCSEIESAAHRAVSSCRRLGVLDIGNHPGEGRKGRWVRARRLGAWKTEPTVVDRPLIFGDAVDCDLPQDLVDYSPARRVRDQPIRTGVLAVKAFDPCRSGV
jgi:hypothetical protein